MKTQLLSALLKTNTLAEHIAAEKHPFVTMLLKGTLPITWYARYLSNLLPMYKGLELYIKQHKNHPPYQKLYTPHLFRSNAIQLDIDNIAKRFTLEASVSLSSQLVTSLEQCMGLFYTRYLGDLSGGQILAKTLSKKYGLLPQELNFYHFDLTQYKSLKACKQEIKNCLDDIYLRSDEQIAVITEAKKVFQCTSNIMDKVLLVT